MLTIHNTAVKRLREGELSLGVGIRLARTVDIARILRTCGYDWIFIDLEYGTISLDTTMQMSVAALSAGITPIVRVPRGEFSLATRALDGGALGIVMPHVETSEEARKIVAELKFPPEGHRSMANNPAALDFHSVTVAQAAAVLNSEILTVAMLESPLAIANARGIAAVPGIDVLLVGTTDLCMASGIPGDFENPRIIEAYGHVLEACQEHQKWPGMGGVYDERLANRYIQMGMRMILSGVDLGFLMAAATQRARILRSFSPERDIREVDTPVRP